jgi:hypothetical protein
MSLPEDLIHASLVGLSAIVLSISILAYLRRRGSRYLFLTLAFTFLTLGQIVDLAETLWLSGQLILLPLLEVHLSHFFDFLMLSCFGIALTRK